MGTFAINGYNSYNFSGYILDAGVLSCSIGVPNGDNQAANGQWPILVTGIFPFFSGRNTTPQGAATINGQGATITLPNTGDSPAQVGIGVSAIFGGAGTGTFQLQTNGAFNFGHQTSVAGINITGSYSEANSTLTGYCAYASAPQAPTLISVTPASSSGTINVYFTGNGNGGAGITRYVIEVSTSSSFTSLAASVATGSASNNISGLTPGTTYYARVCAENAVTAAAGTTGSWSVTKSAVAPGGPGAPTSLSATNSTTAFDTVNLSWTAPSSTGGGITGYDIMSSGTQIASTTGTGTTYTVTGLANNTSYTFTVRARDAYSDSSHTDSADSNSVTITTVGPPGAPTGATAVANGTVAGRIDISWTAPSYTGTGGVTSYSVYYSTGTLVASGISSSARTYAVTGLTPGTSYGFYVIAWNALANTVGTGSVASNIAYATALGQPPAPTGCTAIPNTYVANRLNLSWTGAAGNTGYNIYEVISGVQNFVGTTVGTTYMIDGLTISVHTYVVCARNSVTDATTPPSQGPASAQFSGTPGTTATQPVSNLSVTDVTNENYNGTFTISNATSTALSYANAVANSASTAVTAGTVSDTTSAVLSGSYIIASVPTTTSLTYAVTSPDVPTTPVSKGSITDTTNQIFNGTFSVTAVNNTALTISYAKTAANVTSVATTGTITDNTNTVFNGTFTIASTPSANSLTYAKTASNVSLSETSGSIIDTTNENLYNGTQTILTIPSYNTFTYNNGTTDTFAAEAIGNPYGSAYRALSRAELEIQFRSGWAG